MNGIHNSVVNVAFKDLSGASQARSGRRAKLWKIKKTEEKPEKSDEDKATGSEWRKRSIKRVNDGGGGGRERRRERTTTTTTTTTANNNNNTTNNNRELTQEEEGQKQNKRRSRRRRSENDLQDVMSPSSGTSGHVTAASGRMGVLLARARRALSERRNRSVSQGPQRAISSNNREITPDQQPSDRSECAQERSFKAGRGGGVVAAWATPPSGPDAPPDPSGPSTRRRGSLDSLDYPVSTASTSLG